MVKYALLWALAIVSLFLDMGTTLYLTSHAGYEEGNDTVEFLIERYGKAPGLLLSVIARVGLLSFGVVLQSMLPRALKFVPIVFLLPAAVAPTIHNVVLYVFGVAIL